MSVLIRGMQMPECCYDCPLIRASVAGDYYCAVGNGIEEDLKKLYEHRMFDCPLVEVKAPHGRLGDLDKLWDRMYNYIDNEGAKMPYGDNDFMIHKDSACELIEDASTIIEAEGSEE